jgi:hypothetical protein
VEPDHRTLWLLNPAEYAPSERLRERFESQSVSVALDRTDSGNPTNVAVLRDGPVFLAASSIQRLVAWYDAVVTDGPADGLSVPTVARHLGTRTFRAYRRTDLVGVCQEAVGLTAGRERGTLHAGIQLLSRAGDLRGTVERLARNGTDVYVYGLPDDAPALDSVTVRGVSTEEVRGVWFLVHDAPDGSGTAMVAEETSCDSYRGFVTDASEVVDDLRRYVGDEYH